ncbi:hypothetical protein [Bacillus sp. SJS]|uniref:hypothetical protein n=1 Tax=Bacillus sp. SJS TaxID=1423321 RepID=UPI0004DD18C1|nr:hypothetical protein [Bacillus sp. SJS]KZZ84376.1 hypothetical protein AS29_010980 [Bacillus sp. SJS]
MSVKLNNTTLFPNANFDIYKQNIQIQTYGQRLFRDQTLYEYLLEFLVIFSSPKKVSKEEMSEGRYKFETITEEHNDNLVYYPSPKMALKRFIFLNRSEIDKRFNVDIDALEEHRELLKDKISTEDPNINKEFILNVLQDLLYGFNAIIGKRSWFAQSLLPMAPELIFCEAIGSKTERERINSTSNIKEVDGKFDFNYRAFMARGGEVYYLHVLQGIQELPEIKEKLESRIKSLITSVPQLSKISKFLQNNWELDKFKDLKEIEEDPIEKLDYIKKKMEWIPDNYRKRGANTVEELLNLLSSSVNTTEKIELFTSLIALQVIRMMCLQAQITLYGIDNGEWLIDVINDPSHQIRKMAVTSYERLEENVFRAVHHADLEGYMDKGEHNRTKEAIYEEASKDSNRLIRKLGKQIGLIIPPKGGNMRLSINESLIKVLVLAIVPPGKRMLYTTFLNKCYEHFKIIIGSTEAKKHWLENNELDVTIFNANSEKFQIMLKDCGFLRDLSDSTSIVENPFQE